MAFLLPRLKDAAEEAVKRAAVSAATIINIVVERPALGTYRFASGARRFMLDVGDMGRSP
jgi:hypothetical protein